MIDPRWNAIPVSPFEDQAFIELFPPLAGPETPAISALPVVSAASSLQALAGRLTPAGEPAPRALDEKGRDR